MLGDCGPLLSCGVSTDTVLSPHCPMPHQWALGQTRIRSAHLAVYMRPLGLLGISHRLNKQVILHRNTEIQYSERICIKCTNVKSKVDKLKKTVNKLLYTTL